MKTGCLLWESTRKWAVSTSCLLSLLLGGCASHKRGGPGRVSGEVVIPNSCIEKLEKTDDTYCHGPDGKHIKCDGVTLVREPGCETFSVVNKKGGKKK